MGCSLSAIDDDENEYIGLCEEFGDTPHRTTSGFVDCYGNHATYLKGRRDQKHANTRTFKTRPGPKATKMRVISASVLRFHSGADHVTITFADVPESFTARVPRGAGVDWVARYFPGVNIEENDFSRPLPKFSKKKA